MKVFAFGNPRDMEGTDLITLFATRELAVTELYQHVNSNLDLMGCASIAGLACEEPLDDAIHKFLIGDYDEVGIYEGDDTIFWLMTMEVKGS